MRFPSILYRLSLFFALLLTVVAIPALHAQDDKPIIQPTDRRAPKKKDSSPRALAVLQMTANGKASLLPIAILVDGKFWDATAYKADPVPMALESGTVYEGERAGSSLGLFTIGSALHSNAANAPFPWLGTGTWRPGEAAPTNVPLKASTTPVGIDNAYDPPRLTRNPAAAKPPAPTAQPSTPPPPPTDPDAPPRLTKSDSSPSSSTAPSSTPSTTPPQKSCDPDAPPHLNRPASDSTQKPADSKPSDSKAPDTSSDSSAPSDSGASESGRPRLRRGKPPAPASFDDFPGYSPLATKLATAPTKTNTSPTEKSVIIDMVPAISDANGPEPHSFAFTWLKDEEPDRRKQMLDLAQAELRLYLADRAKNTTSAAPAKNPAVHTALKAKPIDPIFDNIQMRAYDVWNTNVPVIILSAEAHMPPAKTAAKTASQPAPNPDLTYSVLVIAYPDIYQNLHKLFARITDKFHLDIAPRLDLVDVVDADGDTRGELLFKQTSDSSTGWILYRPTADKLYKLFDSLNPE